MISMGEAIEAGNWRREIGETSVTAVLANHGLFNHVVNGPASGIPDEPLNDLHWSNLLSDVSQNRLWLVAAAAVNTGVLPVTVEQAEQILDGEERAVSTLLRVEQATLQVADLLASIGSYGVDFLILKGPAHAQMLWADTQLRAWGDLDILVPEPHMAVVAETLVADLGAVWHDREADRQNAIRFANSMTFTLRSGVEVDLHLTLLRGPFVETLHRDDLWRDNSTVQVGSRQMSGLSPEAMVVHACMHALSNEYGQLTRLRDIAEGLREGSGVDHHRVITLSEQWNCEAVVASAINRAASIFGSAGDLALTDWAALRPGTARQHRWMGYYLGKRRTDRMLFALSIAEAIQHRTRRVAYLRGLAFHGGRDPLPVRLRRLLFD